MIDHVKIMRDRLIEQYKGLPNLDWDLKIPGDQLNELETAIQQFLNEMGLSVCVGAQLDRWGDILNTPREGLEDPGYRTLLYARIAQYISQGTPEELISLYAHLMQVTSVLYSEPWYPAKALLYCSDPNPLVPFSFIKRILNNAKPAGVQLWLQVAGAIPIFSFLEAAGANTGGFMSLDSHNPVYTEDFSTGTVGEDLSVFDPEWLELNNAGAVYTIQAIFGAQGAYFERLFTGEWASAIYKKRTFDATAYFSYEARINGIAPGAGDRALVWNLQAKTLDKITRVGCYIAFVTQTGNVILGKDWSGGVGLYDTLDTQVLPGGTDITDFKLKVIQQGSTIKVYVDGTLVITHVDSSYLSGYIGIEAYNSSYYAELKVEQFPGDGGGIFTFFI